MLVALVSYHNTTVLQPRRPGFEVHINHVANGSEH